MRPSLFLLCLVVLSACSHEQEIPKLTRVAFTEDSIHTAQLNILNAMTPASFDQALIAEFNLQLADLSPRIVITGDVLKANEPDAPCLLTAVGSDVKIGDSLFIIKTLGSKDNRLSATYTATKVTPGSADELGHPILSTAKDELSFSCSNDGSLLTLSEVSQILNETISFVSMK